MWARRSVRYLACIDLSEGRRVSLHAFLPFRLPVNLIAVFIDQTEGFWSENELCKHTVPIIPLNGMPQEAGPLNAALLRSLLKASLTMLGTREERDGAMCDTGSQIQAWCGESVESAVSSFLGAATLPPDIVLGPFASWWKSGDWAALPQS
jgi:hypothetical protein